MVGATQRPPLVANHGPASAFVLPSSTRGVSCSHLGGQDAGRRARVGVGVAGMVHAVWVVMLIHIVTPYRNNTATDRKKTTTTFSFSSILFISTCFLATWILQRRQLCLCELCVGGLASAPYPEPSCSTPADDSSPCGPS